MLLMSTGKWNSGSNLINSLMRRNRHVYFNMTTNTALLFIWSTTHLALLFSFVDRAISCLCVTLGRTPTKGLGPLRWRVLILVCINFYGLVCLSSVLACRVPANISGLRLVGHVQLHQ
jgi:hypothetical protein